jgi:DedD protein
MDSRAKQRLTGAVILVALFVLLVPELLTGPKNAPSPATPSDEGLRRYTIDLNAPAPTNREAAAVDSTVSLPPGTTATAPAAAEPPSGERVSPGESAAPEVVAPAQGPATTPTPAATPAARAETPLPAAPATAATTPATRPPEARIEAARPGRPGEPRGFVVQLGSFSSRENAERLVRDMTARGFATFIAPITTNGRELYRVRVGPTRDRTSAEALATQLKRIGQSGSIVPLS